MYLVIAEKPELAKDIASAILLEMNAEEGAYKGADRNGREYVVISAFGHLMELDSPENYDPKYKQWTLKDLPMLFEDWRTVPSQEEYKKKRLRLIKKYIKECEAVVNAGDPDEEGQLLIDEILDYYHFSKPVYRVLINDNLPGNIIKEFEAMKDNIDFVNIGKSANARRMADMCFGINESRLACLKLKRYSLSIGRVQTPTLGLVVNRDEAIKNHVKETYYELNILVDFSEYLHVPFRCVTDKKYLDEEGIRHIPEVEFFETLLEQIKMPLQIKTTVQTEKVTPPLPYNLTVLQSEMNKKYGYSMSETLQITQNLRDKYKAISYNRSDCRYLKEEHYQAAPGIFKTILNGALMEKFNMDFSVHSKCFHGEDVTAHHAIIPLENQVPYEKFSEEEKNVYMAICLQYAMQFLPPAKNEISESMIELQTGKYTHYFVHKAKKNIELGFLKYLSFKEKQDSIFIIEGQYQGMLVDKIMEKKETQPLKKYTEGTLCLDMANISKYVTDPEIKKILKEKDRGKKGENGSIGTVATRGEIVKKLIERKFLEMDNKNLVSTELGRTFYHLLPPGIASADITARWWLMQEEIKKGMLTDINAIQKSVVEEFHRHKDNCYNTDILAEETEKKIVGICPVCGKDVEKRNGKYGAYFKCSGCDYQAAGVLCKKAISDQDISNLLKGKVILMKGLKGKSGSTFSAEIKLVTEEKRGRLKMKFQ